MGISARGSHIPCRSGRSVQGGSRRVAPVGERVEGRRVAVVVPGPRWEGLWPSRARPVEADRDPGTGGFGRGRRKRDEPDEAWLLRPCPMW